MQNEELIHQALWAAMMSADRQWLENIEEKKKAGIPLKEVERKRLSVERLKRENE